MADRIGNALRVERIKDQSIVSLRVSRNSLDSARDKLALARPLQASGDDPRSLWLGPDRWLLVSAKVSANAMIDSCKQALAGILHNAVDYSAGLAVLRLTGSGTRQLLATGTGADLRSGHFPVNSCCRTRLAQVAAVIVVGNRDIFDVYVDRSYESYMTHWLAESSSICFSYLGTG